MQSIPMRPGYTILINPDAVLIHSHHHNHYIRRSIWRIILELPTKSDAHRKVFGHILLILAGMMAAAIEILLAVSPEILLGTQVILPAIIQEAYDFKWKL